jgi:hypothetical protein
MRALVDIVILTCGWLIAARCCAAETAVYDVRPSAAIAAADADAPHVARLFSRSRNQTPAEDPPATAAAEKNRPCIVNGDVGCIGGRCKPKPVHVDVDVHAVQPITPPPAPEPEQPLDEGASAFWGVLVVVGVLAAGVAAIIGLRRRMAESAPTA